MKKKFNFALAVLAVAGCSWAGASLAHAQVPPVAASAPEGKAAILYQGDIGLTIVPPPGWILDDKTGRKIGALAVLYPQGETWADSEAVLYVNIIRYAKDAPATLARVVAGDVAETKRRTPKIRAVQTAQGRTRDNRETVTWTFDASGSKPTCDAIAYQATPTGVVLIAVSARSPKAREAARVAWEGLANSVVYVRVEQKSGKAKPAPKP